jgi:hypothetical protein
MHLAPNFPPGTRLGSRTVHFLGEALGLIRRAQTRSPHLPDDVGSEQFVRCKASLRAILLRLSARRI